MFVIGPLAVAAVTSPRFARAGRLDALQAAQRTTRLYALASIVVVLLGIGPVRRAWAQDRRPASHD